MTINATAIILLALYVAVASGRASPRDASGTIQNDILKEYVARGTYIYPPRASLRIVTDIFAFCERELPNWNTISISGYHIREAGSTAVQEVAFTFANAIAYVQAAIDAGLDVNRSASGCRSSSTRTTISSRRSRKFRAARPCGRRSCAIASRHQPARAASCASHADGRQHAHRAAARQQHRPRRDAGAGRGARRDAVAALQRPRRGAGVADRGVAGSRCARSRSSRSRPARPTPSIRSAARRGRSVTDAIEREARATIARNRQAGRDAGGHRAAVIQREIQDAAYAAQQRIDSGEPSSSA
jgi:methylmalonyl-CoA mutase N-terminal domain/subunit